MKKMGDGDYHFVWFVYYDSEFIVKRFLFFVTNNNSENIYWDFTGEILNSLKKFLHEVLLLPHRIYFQSSVRNLVWEIWNWISVPLHTFTNLLCSQWSAEAKNEWMYTTTPPNAFKLCKWTTLLCDIWGSHNSDTEGSHLLGCETVSLCGELWQQRSGSALKMLWWLA
jgi:hypothetical protein